MKEIKIENIFKNTITLSKRLFQRRYWLYHTLAILVSAGAAGTLS